MSLIIVNWYFGGQMKILMKGIFSGNPNGGPPSKGGNLTPSPANPVPPLSPPPVLPPLPPPI